MACLRRQAFLTLLIVVALLLWGIDIPAGSALGRGGGIDVGGGKNAIDIAGTASSDGSATRPGAVGSGVGLGVVPRVVSFDCGPAQVSRVWRGGSSVVGCDDPLFVCSSAARLGVAAGSHVGVRVTYPVNGSGGFSEVDCAASPGSGPGVVSAGVVSQVVRRLLPVAPIGTPQPVGLVGLPVLLWLRVSGSPGVGPVVVLGQRVGLRVGLAAVSWSFGDGVSVVAPDAGRVWVAGVDCGRCGEYFGHTYRGRGVVVVTARARWSVQYQVGAGPWQAIPEPIEGPPASTRLLLKESRSVLIPDR
ncbi:hypothetical protein ACSMXN_23540 [Jatrophihabitans sp. DSM 45814]